MEVRHRLLRATLGQHSIAVACQPPYAKCALRVTAPPKVVYNDQYSLEELLQYIEAQAFDNIVISPGPGSPDKGKDIGSALCAT